MDHNNGCNMTVHRDYKNKACPGEYLYNRHGEIAEKVNAIINPIKVEDKKYFRVGTAWTNGKCVGQVGAFTNKDNAIKKAKENNGWKVFDENGKVVYEYEVSKPVTSVAPSAPTKINVTYAVKIEGGRVLPEVKNLEDYAGIENKRITGIAMKVDKGSVKYQVHVLGGGWLPWVTGYNWNDHNNGYAGNGKVIDAVRVYYSTPSDLIKNGGYREAKYRISPIGSTSYYSWQLDDLTKNGMDGYAGAFGKAIDKFQVCIE